jgi:hypothetical protein
MLQTDFGNVYFLGRLMPEEAFVVITRASAGDNLHGVAVIMR